VPISKEQFFTGNDKVSHEIMDFLRSNSNNAYSYADLSSILNIKNNDLYWILTDLQVRGLVESKIVDDKVYYIINP
jgi:hypothetical protein